MEAIENQVALYKRERVDCEREAERDTRADRDGNDAPAEGGRLELYRHPTVVFSESLRPRQRPGQRPPMAHNVRSPMRHAHSLSVLRIASPSILSQTILASCFVLLAWRVSHGLLFLSVSVSVSFSPLNARTRPLKSGAC
jgi:hypothetical protein